jgi:hypothetical protein
MDKKKHKKKDNDIINYYEKIPKKYKNNYHNPNYEKHLINLPFRVLINGSSGSGKTMIALNIIQKFNDTFGNIKICCKDKNEPLYRMLSDKLDPSSFQIYEGFKNIPSLDDKEEFDPSLQHLIIFDDLCLEKNQSIIEDYFIRGRKIAKGVNIIYLTQSYFKCPRVVRMNVNYIILKKVGSTKDLTSILKEYSLGVDLDQLKNIYKKNVVSVTDFLLIDLDATDDKRFRSGFNKILKIKNEDSESDEESDNSSSSDEEMKGCGRNKLIILFNKYKK